MLAANADRFDGLLSGAGAHHPEGHLTVVRGVRGIERPCLAAEVHRRSEPALQIGFQRIHGFLRVPVILEQHLPIRRTRREMFATSPVDIRMQKLFALRP